jgi:hypothetical protein
MVFSFKMRVPSLSKMRVPFFQQACGEMRVPSQHAPREMRVPSEHTAATRIKKTQQSN